MDTIVNALAPLWNGLAEILIAILSALLAAALLALRTWLAAKAGREQADALVSMLHRALRTGVEAYLALKPDATATEVVDAARDHARISIPDTMRKLAPPPDVVTNIALARMGEVRAVRANIR